MQSWLRSVLQRFHYRLAHVTKLPKADLNGCLLNLKRRGLEPQHIIDVGANRGKWTRNAHRVFPNCSFTMIEPQIEMRPHLDKIAAQCPGSRWICAGAGATVGELTFNVCSDTVSSSFVNTQSDADSSPYQQRKVPVITLDHLMAKVIHTVPEIVKIDAEGFEYEILKGARSLLGKTELFFLEAHFFGPSPNPVGIVELASAMSDFGYAPYDFTWFGKRPYDGAVALAEVAFARKQGILRAFDGWSQPLAKAA